MNKLGKAGIASALVLAASAAMAGPGHGSNPVGEPGKAAQATREPVARERQRAQEKAAREKERLRAMKRGLQRTPPAELKLLG